MKALQRISQWFDSGPVDLALSPSQGSTGKSAIDWLRVIPFIAMHLACVAVLWVGVSPVAVWVAVALYLVRMFAITAFYHRYFAHRTFKTSRPVQFVFALLGASATQRGPLWWAAHHRQHHGSADTEDDPHTPQKGLWWSHMGWFLSTGHFRADYRRVADWARYPELRWLDRFDVFVPALLAVALYGLGALLEQWKPHWGTSPWQMVIWGYFISTVVLTHSTLTINSLAHRWGTRRFDTRDDSRNNAFLALITLGEGWHNNHHHYPASARQGFYWWQLDISYYLIRLLGVLGLVWDIRPVPRDKLEEGKLK
ncbi:MAG: acyl-CoA desaturase [Pseudomonadota bacterium]